MVRGDDERARRSGGDSSRFGHLIRPSMSVPLGSTRPWRRPRAVRSPVIFVLGFGYFPGKNPTRPERRIDPPSTPRDRSLTSRLLLSSSLDSTVRLVVLEPVVSCATCAASSAGRTRTSTRRTSVPSGRSPSPAAPTPRASSSRSSVSRPSSPTPPSVSAAACS